MLLLLDELDVRVTQAAVETCRIAMSSQHVLASLLITVPNLFFVSPTLKRSTLISLGYVLLSTTSWKVSILFRRNKLNFVARISLSSPIVLHTVLRCCSTILNVVAGAAIDLKNNKNRNRLVSSSVRQASN